MIKINYEDEKVLWIPNITDESWIQWIKAIEFYKQRFLNILDEKDLVVMPSLTKKYNDTLFEIYKELEIPFLNPENIIYVDYDGSITSSILETYSEIYKQIDWKVKKLFPFIHSKKIDNICKVFNLETSRTSYSSEIINDKAIAQQELRKLWVKTPLWKIVFSYEEAQNFFIELKNMWYDELAVKIRRSASWMWVFKVRTLDELEEKISNHQDQLEDWILIYWWIQWEFLFSPNIQYYIWKNPHDDIFIWSSIQILSDDWTVHLWNISNMDLFKNEKLVKDLFIIRNWIRSKKAYWIVWIDFSVFKNSKTGEEEAYFMEINWRVNWSTHWPIIASKIFEDNFQDRWAIMNNLFLPKNMTINDFITSLQRDWIYFDPSKKRWVIPTNVSAIDNYWKAMIWIFWEKEYILKVMNILKDYSK